MVLSFFFIFSLFIILIILILIYLDLFPLLLCLIINPPYPISELSHFIYIPPSLTLPLSFSISLTLTLSLYLFLYLSPFPSDSHTNILLYFWLSLSHEVPLPESLFIAITGANQIETADGKITKLEKLSASERAGRARLLGKIDRIG